MLKSGDLAPHFQLLDQNNHTVSLSDFIGKQNLVIFFYPKDHTAGCTAQSCSFRDNYSAFKGLDAQVLGISADSLSSHQGFATEYNLPFPLLSDQNGAVATLFGVKKTLGFLPGRVSFVIDKQGVIRHVFSSQMQVRSHVDETLTALKNLEQK